MRVSIEVGKECHLVEDGLVAEVASSSGKITVLEVLGLVSRLHWVNEKGFLWVTKISEFSDCSIY